MAHLNIRLPDQEKAAIERAAVAEKMTVTAYVRHRLLSDLTGDALAQKIAQLIKHSQPSQQENLLSVLDARIAEVAVGMGEHREDFTEFRTKLADALKQILAAVKEAK